jgi:hypothetical protein
MPAPQDCQIIRTFISQKPPIVSVNTVRDTDDNLVLVVESEFGAAFPNVPTVINATIVDQTNLTVVFNSGPISVDPTLTFVQTVIPITPAVDPFAGRANHTCAITAFLSANINPNFAPDASLATSLFLVTD